MFSHWVCTNTKQESTDGTSREIDRRRMSKKNNLSRRKNQYEFDLRREKAEREKKAMKLKSKSSKMKVCFFFFITTITQASLV